MTTPQIVFERAVADRGLAITGATGWIGLVALRMAIRAGLHLRGARLRLLAASPRTITIEGVSLDVQALSDATPLTGEGWIILHAAFLGRERSQSMEGADYAERNNSILERVLRWAGAAEDVRFIFPSSGAVYGPTRRLVTDMSAQPYGVLKLEHEAKLTTWAQARKARLVVPRVFNIGGPLANKRNLYALTSLIDQARSGTPLTIEAKGQVWRSYVPVEELVSLLVFLAARQDGGVVGPFDTVGLEEVEIGDLAQRILAVMGHEDLEIKRQQDPSAPINRYVGQGEDYGKWVEASGLVRQGLDDIIQSAISNETTLRPL